MKITELISQLDHYKNHFGPDTEVVFLGIEYGTCNNEHQYELSVNHDRLERREDYDEDPEYNDREVYQFENVITIAMHDDNKPIWERLR